MVQWGVGSASTSRRVWVSASTFQGCGFNPWVGNLRFHMPHSEGGRAGGTEREGGMEGGRKKRI